ncbi:MAG: transglutaminase-like domain-containing protein [Thermoplasmata archaeon]
MVQTEPMGIECRKCGGKNVNVFEDKTGHCLDCNDAFADVNEYLQRPKYNSPKELYVPDSGNPVSQPMSFKKIAAISVVIIIILASIGFIYAKYHFNPVIAFDDGDLVFFGEYPSVPSELRCVNVKSDVLWGEFSPFIDNSIIQTVQISPTIENLAKQFVDHYSSEYERIEATYNFVAKSIKYDSSVDRYQYPVTTLQTKKGVCADYASLLGSLLYAEGIKDIAFIFTNSTPPHVYVTVKLSNYVKSYNAMEVDIRTMIGDNWIAMDPTNTVDGGYFPFREFNSADDSHREVVTIVKIPVFGCVYDLDCDLSSDDPELGNCWNIECELMAFGHGKDNDVSFTFQWYENDVLASAHKIDLASQNEFGIKIHNFKLDITESFAENYSENDTMHLGMVIAP